MWLRMHLESCPPASGVCWQPCYRILIIADLLWKLVFVCTTSWEWGTQPSKMQIWTWKIQTTTLSLEIGDSQGRCKTWLTTWVATGTTLKGRKSGTTWRQSVLDRKDWASFNTALTSIIPPPTRPFFDHVRSFCALCATFRSRLSFLTCQKTELRSNFLEDHSSTMCDHWRPRRDHPSVNRRLHATCGDQTTIWGRS